MIVKNHKLGSVVFSVLSTLMFSTPLALVAADQTPIALQQIPPSTKMITVALSLADTGPQDGNSWSSSGPTKVIDTPAEVSAIMKNKDASVFSLGAFENVGKYYVSIFNDTSLPMLGRPDSKLWYAQIFKVDQNNKAEIVKEGYCQNSQVDYPVTIPITKPGGGTFDFTTKLGFSIGGSQGDVPYLQTTQRAMPTLQGSQIFEPGRLNVTLALDDELKVSTASKVTLKFTPLKPGLPERTATGKAADLITLGSARFAVSEVAGDLTSITIGIVSGSLEETVEQQLRVGTEMPNFSQTDLLTRSSITRADVIGKIKENTSAAVFIFGDFRIAQQGYYGGPQMTGYLPSGADQIVNLISAGLKDAPAIYFVVRDLDMNDYFGKYAVAGLPYTLIADNADPARTNFRVTQSGGYMGGMVNYPNDSSMTLRQLFNMPGNVCSVAAFDASGKAIFVTADASGDKFANTLGDLNAILIGTK